jgi:membrane protease YdiL (CAAX protease family)
MDVARLVSFSALPLAALLGLFWYLQRLSRVEVGFVWASARHFGLALLHPVLVIGVITAIALATGAVDIEHTDWRRAALNFALMTISTMLIALVTGEGFFRGWLWASLKRAGQSPSRVLLWSSLAFVAWHLSAVLLPTGFNPPPAQIPVYLVNATLLGAIWGMLRMISGSVLVASVAHGLWNGFAYVFFGFGSMAGALGIEDTATYGPEIGWLGLVANLLFAAWLWRMTNRSTQDQARPHQCVRFRANALDRNLATLVTLPHRGRRPPWRVDDEHAAHRHSAPPHHGGRVLPHGGARHSRAGCAG